MQIPSLVESVHQRMLNVVKVELPRGVDGRTILCSLLGSELNRTFCRTVQQHGKNIRRAVGEPDASSRQGHLHDFASKVAGEVCHVLMRSSDIAPRRVVISPEMRGDTSTF